MSGNMKLLLDKETLNSKVIIPDSAEFEAITSNVEAVSSFHQSIGLLV